MAEMPETRFTRAGEVDIAYQVVGSGPCWTWFLFRAGCRTWR